MKYIYQSIFILFVIGLLPVTMQSEPYREKYSAVLQHYMRNRRDSLKYRAALFLIDNMDGHISPQGKQIEAFKNKVIETNTHRGLRVLNEAWNLSGKDSDDTRQYRGNFTPSYI